VDDGDVADGAVADGAVGLTDETAMGGRFDNVTNRQNWSKSSWVMLSH
jgi:hypothetical protein